jgi:putative RNA 2'-phosphotransferase
MTVLFHGTPRDNVEAIRRDGLRPRSRDHVHLSEDLPTALRVGGRRSADVVVFEVAASAMAAAGHVFHRSENGVWLTAEAPPAYVALKRTNP